MNFPFTNPKLMECQAVYNSLDPEEALIKSHFDLAKDTTIKDKDLWKEFLMDPRVSHAINEELTLYKQTQQRKLIQKATSNDKSMGTAQMINSLGKAIEATNERTGEIFIYGYVPMTSSEAKSPCVTAETTDIFEEQ